MGSAEQEVVIENILRLVPEDKVTTAVSCDVSNHVEDEKNTENNGSKISAEVELPAAVELQRNEVNTTLTREATEESHLVRREIETLAVQDEITLMSYQPRSALPRVSGSQTVGEPGSTYWSSAVPLSNDLQYSFRFVIPRSVVPQFIGRNGYNVKSIVSHSAVSSIYVDKDGAVINMQTVNVFGQPINCDIACEEILKFVFTQSTGRPPDADSQVRLQLMVEDTYCGLLIGRNGRTMHELRQKTSTRISISKLLYDEKFMAFYPERVVFITGGILNVVHAQSEISHRLHELRSRDRDNPFPLSQGPVRSNISGAALSSHLICDIVVSNAQAGAVIGRQGSHIKTIMSKSRALVAVLPKHSEISSDSETRYVRIAGTQEAVFRASYCVLLHMIRWLPSRPDIDAFELDVQLIVPAAAVGHIIGRHGRRVRRLQAAASVHIWLLHAPQPPPTPTGASRSRVRITGNFWQTQKAVSLIWDIVQSVERRAGSSTIVPLPRRGTADASRRQLAFMTVSEDRSQQPTHQDSSSGRELHTQPAAAAANEDDQQNSDGLHQSATQLPSSTGITSQSATGESPTAESQAAESADTDVEGQQGVAAADTIVTSSGTDGENASAKESTVACNGAAADNREHVPSTDS